MKKKKLRRQIIKLLEQQRTPEGDWYFDPKLQRAFEGVRGRIASTEKRLRILEADRLMKNVVPMRRTTKRMTYP